jgi:hypothetical protein
MLHEDCLIFSKEVLDRIALYYDNPDDIEILNDDNNMKDNVDTSVDTNTSTSTTSKKKVDSKDILVL